MTSLKNYQHMTVEQLSDWLRENDITLESLAAALLKGRRTVARYLQQNPEDEIPADLAVLLNVIDALAPKRRAKLLQDMRALGNQKKPARGKWSLR